MLEHSLYINLKSVCILHTLLLKSEIMCKFPFIFIYSMALVSINKQPYFILGIVFSKQKHISPCLP